MAADNQRTGRWRALARHAACCAVALFLCTARDGVTAADVMTRALPMRDTMLAEIAQDYRETADYTGLHAMSDAVRRALAAVPRDAFVSASDRDRAYMNRPLSIGHGQTISQPFIVALMTDLAALSPGDRVLEIGTGSGYQAAVLAALGAEVYTIEIVAPLGLAARERLARFGYRAEVRIGDGNAGWPEHAPFDAILVTAAGPLPTALTGQLKAGGRLVMPIGAAQGTQQLTVFTRDAAGQVTPSAKLPVRFVPLTGATDGQAGHH